MYKIILRNAYKINFFQQFCSGADYNIYSENPEIMVRELVVLYLALLFQNSTELFRETHKLTNAASQCSRPRF